MRSVGKRADGQVVVAGPAEAAEVRAAADDFDEEARSELGVGREDARRRRIDGVGGLERRLAHRAPARRRRPTARSRAIVPSSGVLRLVERRHVEAALARRAGAAGRRGRSPRRTRDRAPGTSTSPSPAAITSANGASGSGLTNVTAPPIDDERMAVGALGRVARHAGQPQQREDVHVVPLEGHGERDDVEVADRRLRLERDERRVRRRRARRAPASAAGTRARRRRRPRR